MITLRRLPRLQPLCLLAESAPYGIKRLPVTEALAHAFFAFLKVSPGVASVTPFRIMPDHIHFLIRLNPAIPAEERCALPQYVRMLRRWLTEAYQSVTGFQGEVFEGEWHDYIVKSQGQLKNFGHYILNNGVMALRRRAQPDWFRIRTLEHPRLPERCWALGNVSLLDYPSLRVVQVSRSVRPDVALALWQKEVEGFRDVGEGDVVIGGFFSTGEQAVRRLVLAQGGAVIVLLPNGFEGAQEVAAAYFRWHPSGDGLQLACAEGRMLFLSWLDPHLRNTEKPASLRTRCLQMNRYAATIAQPVE